MPYINLNASKLREMVKAAEKYGVDNNVSFYKVYLRIDTGINAGSYVISDEEWDERERLGVPHPAKPAIPLPSRSLEPPRRPAVYRQPPRRKRRGFFG